MRRLAAAGIPVVTLVTDLPASGRLAYVGIDNRAAGATAAYLIGQWLGDRPGNVLVTPQPRLLPRRGGTRDGLPGDDAGPLAGALVEIDDSDGLDATMRGLVGAALAADPGIRAVYSIGGGNSAIVEAFDDAAGVPVFVAPRPRPGQHPAAA